MASQLSINKNVNLDSDFDELHVLLNAQQKKLLKAFQRTQLPKNEQRIGSQSHDIQKSNSEYVKALSDLHIVQEAIGDYDQRYVTLYLQQQELVSILQNTTLLDDSLSVDVQQKEVNSEYVTALSIVHNSQEFIVKAIIPDCSETMNLYGAKQVLIDSLPYTVGSEMVKRSKGFFGIVSLPFFIIKKYKALKSSNIQDLDIMPDLSNYIDYMDAERPKKHLSYKSGLSLVTSAKNNHSLWLMFIQLYQNTKQLKKQLASSK